MFIKFIVFNFLSSVCFIYGKDCKAKIDVENSCTIFNGNTSQNDLKNLIRNHSNNDKTTLLVFYVKANRNANITLISCGGSKRKYTVSLAAENPSRLEPKEDRLTNYDNDIISSDEWRGFWIEIIPDSEPDGPKIKMGRKGSEWYFINKPISGSSYDIAKYRFSTGPNDTAKWGIACATDNGKKLYDNQTERLNCDLFHSYNNSLPPSATNRNNQTIHINVSLIITAEYINSDEGSQILKLDGAANITWVDDRLNWKEDTDTKYPPFLTMDSDSLWKPTIILASNSSQFPNLTNFSSDNITITNQKILIWNPSFHIQVNNTAMKNSSDKLITCRMEFKMNFSERIFETLIIENPAIISNDSVKIDVLAKNLKQLVIILKDKSQFQPPVPVEEINSRGKFAQILKCHQFANYDRFEGPQSATRYQTVIEMKNHQADLNFIDGIFELNGEAKIFWFDERFNWNPKKYSHQYIPSIENDFTWKPDITINSLPIGAGKTIISSDGILMWNPTTNIKTKCDVDLENWPWTSHKCEKITIQINTPGAEFAKPRIEFPETSHWLISGFYSSDLITMRNTTSIEIHLEKKITLNEKWLFIQFTVTSLTMLCSFGISASRSGKIVLNIGSLLLLTFYYITLLRSIPPHVSSAPKLLNDYSVLLVIGVLSNVLSISLSILMRKSRNIRLPKFIFTIIDNRFVRLALFLTHPKEPKDLGYKDYLHMENLRAGIRRKDEDDPRTQTEKENEKNLQADKFRKIWLKMAAAFDHLAFLVLCFLFVRMVLNDFQPILKLIRFLRVFFEN